MYMRFEVLIAVLMKTDVFWDTLSCQLVYSSDISGELASSMLIFVTGMTSGGGGDKNLKLREYDVSDCI